MINVKQWMDLLPEVRLKIIKDFNLERTGRMGISNNKIVSDGYTQNDILKITLPKLQELLDSEEESFDVIFADYVNIVKDSINIIEEVEMIEFMPDVVFETTWNLPIGIKPETDIIHTNMIGVASIGEIIPNPNQASSGDTLDYLGRKIKPVSYIPKKIITNKNVKK